MHTWRTPGRDDIWAPVLEIVVDFIWREGCSYRESPGVKEQLDGLAGEDTYPKLDNLKSVPEMFMVVLYPPPMHTHRSRASGSHCKALLSVRGDV